MHTEDSLRFLISWLRNPEGSGYSSYGYDVYLPDVMRVYLAKHERVDRRQEERRMIEISPAFYAAAWELCRRGILRPGVRRYRAQATADGSGGSGFSVTPFGYTWLQEAEKDDYVPTEPERVAQMLRQFERRFGAAFHARAQEAVRCYGA